MASRFRPDRQLTARMVVTILLLLVVYAAFVAALVVLVKSVVLVIVIAGGFLAAQYWFSDRIALYAMHATVVERDAAPQLHGVVDRLCAAANMDKPKIAIAHTDLPNAFATGRNSKRAVLCVTDGLQRRLTPDELEGVLAHELSHVAHRDVAVMTIASFLGVLAGLVMRFGFYSTAFGGGGRSERDEFGMIMLAVLAVSGAVYGISFLLTRALSRYRELAADRAAAMLTGQPSVLASALVKVSDEIGRIPNRDLRSVQAFNAFFFAPATKAGLAALLSTHPTLQQRLDQLAKISAQLQRP